MVPALLAGAESINAGGARVTGRDLLLAAVAGFETGPRAGLALYGPDMLTRGWHSGPIFGRRSRCLCCRENDADCAQAVPLLPRPVLACLALVCARRRVRLVLLAPKLVL